MLFIVVAALTAVVAIAALAAPRKWFIKEKTDRYRGETITEDYSGVKWVAFGIAVAVLVVVGCWRSVVIVEAGHVAVVREFGQIIGQREEGMQFIAPWQSVRHESIQVRRADFSNRDGALGRIDAASLETQDVFFDVTLNWQVSPLAVQQLHRNVGPSFFSVLVPTRVHQYFKQEVVGYTAIEATQKREEIRQRVTERLREDLEAFSITVVSLQIDSISYQPEFSRAIEDKQVATQEALRERERIERERAIAEQAVETARGQANANIERARGDAEAIRLNAAAVAEANTLIAQSLTADLIQFEALKHLDGIQLALLPADGNFLLDPSGILGRGTTP